MGFCDAKMTARMANTSARINVRSVMKISYFNICPQTSSSLRLGGNRQGSHKSLCAEFFNVFAYHFIIETNLFGDVEDRVIAFEAHHDPFDGTVEIPVIAPIDPQTVTAEKNGTA